MSVNRLVKMSFRYSMVMSGHGCGTQTHGSERASSCTPALASCASTTARSPAAWTPHRTLPKAMASKARCLKRHDKRRTNHSSLELRSKEPTDKTLEPPA